MRIAVFRAAGDGRRTVEKLAALGHAAVLAPVIEIVSTGQRIPGESDMLVFTSAHAVEALDSDTQPKRLRTLPCYCVGSRTAEAAEAFGFSEVRRSNGDAAVLAGLIMTEVAPSAKLVLVAGRDRKPTIEDTLRGHGFRLDVVEVYRARAVECWPPAIVEALGRTCEAALHYSRRSADLAVQIATAAGLDARMRLWRHYCLSDDIAAGLHRHGITNVEIASRPDEPTLLACL